MPATADDRHTLPSVPEKIRVILTDDHDLLRAGLRAMLEFYDDLEVVGEARNGEEAVEMYERLRPTVIAMDISMPIMDGIAATQRICSAHPEARVIIMTQHEEQQLIEPALKAGVSGFITKRSAGPEFVAALRAVAAGEFYIHPKMARLMAAQVQNQHVIKPEDTLTTREREVLREIIAGKTNSHIARDLCLSIKTVEWHRSNLMAKLDTHSVVELVRYALAHGLAEGGSAGTDLK